MLSSDFIAYSAYIVALLSAVGAMLSWAIRVSITLREFRQRILHLEEGHSELGERQTTLEHQYTLILQALAKIEGKLDVIFRPSLDR